MIQVRLLLAAGLLAISGCLGTACTSAPAVPASLPDASGNGTELGVAGDGDPLEKDTATPPDAAVVSDTSAGGGALVDAAPIADSLPETADTLDCPGYPKEGCPCNPNKDEECCTGPGRGLLCHQPMAWDPSGPRWERFWDCPCEVDAGATCPNYPPAKGCNWSKP